MKMGAWVIMMVSVVVFLTLLGIETGVTTLLSSFGIGADNGAVTSDIQNSSIWSKIFGSGIGILVILGTGASILVGLFGKGYDPSIVVAPFIVSVGLACMSSFGAVLISLGGADLWARNIVTFVLGGLSIGFLFSCVDYFRGI